MGSKYEEAIECLNSRKATPKPTLDKMRGSDDMSKWLSLLGHSNENLDRLNAVHIAGTNGKGSTCAFASSFLKAHGRHTGYPRKVGLYTSPHMEHIRERIRINGDPISEECFASRFFEMWTKLPKEATENLDIPRYLQLLALLAFHVFITEKVDVAIFETHMGGEWDATNVISSPIVVGISTIAMDHVHLLGPTIEDITWHKSGIFKPSASAFSTVQSPVVTTVLQRRAGEKGVSLEFVGINTSLPQLAALVPKAQRINCSLALAIVQSWLRFRSSGSLDKETVTAGVEQFSWPGRFEQIHEGRHQWYLDGAHNESSLQITVDWFAKSVIHTSTRVLIFAHFSTRDSSLLLRYIAESFKSGKIEVAFVIFTSYDETQGGKQRSDRNVTNRFSPHKQLADAETWKSVYPRSTVLLERTIEGALDQARSIGDVNDITQILVTGSLHLVSGAMHLMRAKDVNDSDSIA